MPNIDYSAVAIKRLHDFDPCGFAIQIRHQVSDYLMFSAVYRSIQNSEIKSSLFVLNALRFCARSWLAGDHSTVFRYVFGELCSTNVSCDIDNILFVACCQRPQHQTIGYRIDNC